MSPVVSKTANAEPPVPTVDEVSRIAEITNPFIRNLQITQCYSELSAAIAARTGPVANWCTFATWASKQAGQTIRTEDLKRTLAALLDKEPGLGEALSLIARLAKQLGAAQTAEQIRQSALGSLVAAAAERAGNAVSRGNKKVFEEIGRLFASFLAHCIYDPVYNKAHIDAFCSQLKPGNPPDGQEYLRRAFTRYYASLFETDVKKKAEAQFLANIEIGFHEQNRLQPEIFESLNTADIDPKWVKNNLLAILFPNTRFNSSPGLFLISFFRKTAILDHAIEALVQRAQHLLRKMLTGRLMSLTFPPDLRLQLGRDLLAAYPASLLQVTNQDLLALLAIVDPTRDSVLQSGATDWADLKERMHYITDLFRCYHENAHLFNPAFSKEQVALLKAGKLPPGRL
ncbi:hypothetical protein EXU57_14615 [Segetibacter sp. 3557_3]|uniref:hypothetical protein n=1 Tax=Segetibacter sp. 3557_3 TaxID=2547429 RepID=UPI0010591886|nr:hypothetical protein [Segetibacter sp. 3557_3]TDH24571.1 hypothetical protein EXU57_14615 [Segetibacter sp. 3557_3]